MSKSKVANEFGEEEKIDDEELAADPEDELEDDQFDEDDDGLGDDELYDEDDDAGEDEDLDEVDDAELGAPVGDLEHAEATAAEKLADENLVVVGCGSPCVAKVTVESCQVASDKDVAAALAFEKRIAKLEHNLSDAVLEERRLAARLKSAKATVKEISETLDESRMRGPERLPLFDQQQKEAAIEQSGEGDDADTEQPAGGEGGDVMASAVGDDEPAEPADPDAWREVDVNELDIPEPLLARLAEGGIETIGQLEDLRAGAGLLSLEGVGRAKADKIEDAVLAWLSNNRDGAVLSQTAAAS